MQQLFVKNQVGRSVGVFVDLEEDVYSLADAFADREGYPLSLTPSSLRFVFCGRQLEPGMPLSKYGVSKGSTINAHVRLQSTPAVQISPRAAVPAHIRNEIFEDEEEDDKENMGREQGKTRPRPKKMQELAKHKVLWVRIGATILNSKWCGA